MMVNKTHQKANRVKKGTSLVHPGKPTAAVHEQEKAADAHHEGSADGPPAPLVAPLSSAEFGPKNEQIRESYKAFMPKVDQYADCGTKVQGLLTQLRNDLGGKDANEALNKMGLAVRIVRGKPTTGEIALRGGWSGVYHVYLRCEDEEGNDYLYDPYINAGNCRGTTAEDSALPDLWETPMKDMEFYSVAGAGTDIPISDYMNEYQGEWKSLVEHAIAREEDPNLAGTYEGWWG